MLGHDRVGGVVLVPLAMLAGIVAWLWPIGLGGQMPVGGDVTQFSIGLMAELGRALRAGRLPVWNDLWGFGFPGLAESQMGVYYPPHLLYGVLTVERAYVALLVAHTAWSAVGAAWAARQFGAGAIGAAVAGFAWATSGFAEVHVPHHWAAATACWMPWAWGLAWRAAMGRGGPREAIGLAGVLAIQLLPGHFQVAFLTEVGVVLIGIAGLMTREGSTGSRGPRAIALGLALVGTVPLAIAQLGPTWELAGLARGQRTGAYLGDFAATPGHLVSYLAPGLFRISPLWRPLVWDAFHVIPEEHRATIGLIPLLLACLAGLRFTRRDPACRALVGVAIAMTWLSLGPYAPGFSTLVRLPGFSFFRAPARWGAGAMLALSLLAGRGVDVWSSLIRPGRVVASFLAIGLVVVGLVVGLWEGALAATEPTGPGGSAAWPVAARWLERGFASRPWTDGPALAERLRATRRPLDDPRVAIELARQGRPASASDRTLSRSRASIYRQELGPTAIFAGLIGLAGLVARRSRAAAIGLFGLVLVAEPIVWSRSRGYDLGPIRSLTEQSPVLATLADAPRGTRSLDPARNLFMAVDVGVLEAYRTLDLPAVPRLVRLASLAESDEAARAIGADVRITQGGPGEPPAVPPGWRRVALVDDPTLLGWLTGADWVRSLGDRAPTRFAIDAADATEPRQGWFVSAGYDRLGAIGDDPGAILAILRDADGLRVRTPRPGEAEFGIEADRAGTAILPRLAYPRWRANLTGASEAREIPIRTVFGGWQAVEIPGGGNWRVRLDYDRRPDLAWLGVSALAWLGWLVVYWKARRRDGARAGESDDDRRGDRGGLGLLGPGTVRDPAEAPRGADHGGDLAAG